VSGEERSLRFRLFMLTIGPEVFLTESSSFEDIVDAMRDIFNALWVHNALYEFRGFKVERGDD